MNILITGGAGFIGSKLALALVTQEHKVTVLDNLSRQIHGNQPAFTSPLYRLIREKVNFIEGSVTDPGVWKACLPEQQAVVHLAAETGTGQSMYEVQRYVDVNIGGTALMLDWLANHRHAVTRLVVASSRAIYGEGKYVDGDGAFVYPGPREAGNLRAGRFDPICARTGAALKAVATDEVSEIHPTSVYGITKHAQEQLVMTCAPTSGIAPVSLRYQNVYGPGQSLTNPYTGILSIFSTRILNGRAIEVFEDGLESRDFVYVDDVVDATYRAIFEENAGGKVIGIGSGIGTSVLSLARQLADAYGVDIPINVNGAFRVGDIRHNFADPIRAREVLSFTPKTDLAVGIDNFVKWVLSQDIPADTYDSSISELSRRGLYAGDLDSKTARPLREERSKS